MIDVEKTIISQYGTSATITQLIQNMNTYIDPRTDFDNFYDFVWNVETAQGFGLDIWGRIVNISRELQIPVDGPYLGFQEAGDSAYPFNQGVFYSGAQETQTFILADDAYRQLILVKALANISSTNAPSINQLLQNLFIDRGRCYVNDTGDMTIRYTFEFTLTPSEYAIVTQSGAFPRPAGVLATYFNNDLPLFGFAEAGSSASPFNVGVFYNP
jgi:hypothetical protein